MVKSRRMRWAGHVACMGKREMYTKFLSENQKGRNHLEDLVVAGKIVLEWILGKRSGKVWTGFIWLRKGTSARLL
jgi:hypothetical protein